jgi:hypothetical protein
LISTTIQRVRGLLFSPSAEFAQIAAEPTDMPVLVRRFLLPLALLTAIATIVGMNSFDVAWDVEQGYRVPKERILNIGVANFAFEILTVLMAGLIFFVLTTADQKERSLVRSMNVAVYGAVPLLLSGVLLFVPINVTICMAAMVHTFILYWIGVQKVMHIRPANASLFVALAMIVLFGASTLLGAFSAMIGVL